MEEDITESDASYKLRKVGEMEEERKSKEAKKKQEPGDIFRAAAIVATPEGDAKKTR